MNQIPNCPRCRWSIDTWLEHNCKIPFYDHTDWWYYECRADWTRHPVKTKENPKTILRQTKKRGIKK